MPFVNSDVLSPTDFAKGRAKVFEVRERDGTVAVEDIVEIAMYMATGYSWPNLSYRNGKSQLREKMPGTRPGAIEIYRRQRTTGEYEWTVLFVFHGDVETLRRRRMLFNNAELYIPPQDLYDLQMEVFAIRAEQIEKAKASAARVEGGIVT